MRIIIDIDVKGDALEVDEPEAELRYILEQALAYLCRDGKMGEGSRWLMDSNGNSVGRVVLEESAEE